MNDNYARFIPGILVGKQEIPAAVNRKIDEFVRAAPMLTERLRSDLSENKIPNFTAGMKTMHSMLKAMYARFLEPEAERIIREAEFGNIVYCRKVIESFIADVLSLSIEIQMTQSQPGGNRQKKEIETYTEIVNSANAVMSLISGAEFDRACSLIWDSAALDKEPLAAELTYKLQAYNQVGAMEAAKALKDKYSSIIKNLRADESGSKPSLLAVDDRPDILQTVSGILSHSYKVLTVTSGWDALRVIEKKTPNLFILDIEMPEMSGFELAKAIRAMNKYSRTPILFLTGNATREYVINAVKSGGNDFIVKPPNRNTLLNKVGKYLL